MRIIIAEDAVILRDGLAQLLAMRGHDVATVGDAAALHVAVAAQPPDVAVIDIRMPPTHTDEGLRAALDLRQRRPTVGLLLFSQYIEARYARTLLAEGAAGVGYLLKERVVDIDEFVDALNRIASGGTALAPEVVSQLIGADRRDELATLTAREQQVLALMAEGRTNAALARTFVVTERAVEKHIANIFTKLGLAADDNNHRRVLAVLRYLNGRHR